MTRTEPQLIDGFVVQGDLAYLPDEWERILRRRARQNAQNKTPEARARRRETSRRWREKHREEWRAYNREWMRRYRRGGAVASLHDLRCTGPTRATGCRCTHKIRLYAQLEEAA